MALPLKASFPLSNIDVSDSARSFGRSRVKDPNANLSVANASTVKNNYPSIFRTTLRSRLRRTSKTGAVRLSSTFVHNACFSKKNKIPANRSTRKKSSLTIVDEMAGQYEENFDDVDKQMIDFFTFKAVRTVLAQLNEMNPPSYAWFYNFVVNNKPKDSKLFIRALVKERQDLAERVMVTRLHLFSKWAKKYDHAAMHQNISDQNLELLRERLAQTVVFITEGEEAS